MKRLALVVLAVVVSGCGVGSRTRDVTDVTKSSTIVLKKDARQGHIHSLAVIGGGKIDGQAEISLILNGEPYKTEKLSGPVDFQWDGDWYSDRAEIRYKTISVTGGKLELTYEFKDM